MKRATLLKASVLSVAMALGMLSPMSASAQRDDFIDGGYALHNETFGTDWAGYTLFNQTFGQDAPLGGGLLVLGAAGIGYAAMRRRKNA